MSMLSSYTVASHLLDRNLHLPLIHRQNFSLAVRFGRGVKGQLHVFPPGPTPIVAAHRSPVYMALTTSVSSHLVALFFGAEFGESSSAPSEIGVRV